MSVFELRKKSLAVLLLAFMASAMLPACSSSEESEDASSDCYEGGPGWPDCKL
jgi:hypothetical protein